MTSSAAAEHPARHRAAPTAKSVVLRLRDLALNRNHFPLRKVNIPEKKLGGKILEQSCLIELSVKMEMFCVCAVH